MKLEQILENLIIDELHETAYFLVNTSANQDGTHIKFFLDGDEGIPIEDCSRISRVVSKYVDEEVSVHRKPKKVRFLKMKVLEFRKEGQVIKESKEMIDANATVITDDHKSYKKLPDIIK